MWIPIQPDGVSLRRLPMVTFVFLGLLGLGQIGVSLFPKPRLKTSLQQLVTFSGNHSYLPTTSEIDALVRSNRHTVNIFPQQAGSARSRAVESRQLDTLAEGFFTAWHRHPLYLLGFRPPTEPKINLITYAFISGSFFLCLWNLFFFYVCAPYIEDRWGRPYFGIFLVSSIVIGAMGHGLHSALGTLPLTGAGPLVAGVLGAYAVLLDEKRIPIRPLISKIDNEYLVPAWSIFLFWLLGTGLLLAAIRGSIKLSGQSLASLVYPFIFGLAVAGFIRWRKMEKVLYKSPFDRLEKDQQFLVKIDRELRVGSPKKAFEIMHEACREFPDHMDFLQKCWDQAVRLGQTEKVMDIGNKLLRHHFSNLDLDAACFLFGEIKPNKPEGTVPIDLLCEWSQQLLLAGRGRQAADLLYHMAPRELPERQSVERTLQLASDGDPNIAKNIINRWLKTENLDSSDLAILKSWQDRLEHLAPKEEKESPEAIPIIADDPFQNEVTDPFAASLISQFEIMAIQPIALHKEAISIRMPNGTRKSLPIARILALSGAQIRGLDGATYFLLDLHLDDPWKPRAKHRLLRIHSHRLGIEDPLGQRLLKGEAVFIKLGARLISQQARILPEHDLFEQTALPEFASIADFEAEVYGSQSSDQDIFSN